MSETQAAYYTTIECTNCHTVVAKRNQKGEVIMGVVPVMAALAICPECGRSVPLLTTDVGNGLEFNALSIERIAKTLALIREDGGFGVLIVKFQKGRARWAGPGEALMDCW